MDKLLDTFILITKTLLQFVGTWFICGYAYEHNTILLFWLVIVIYIYVTICDIIKYFKNKGII